MKKRIVAALLLMACLMSGCALIKDSKADGAKDTTKVESLESTAEDTTKKEETAPDTTAEPVIVPAKENLNLLTGLYDLTDGAIGKRPVAVMVNNITVAMPQYGIDKADIVYEIPVEGYQTRLMCIYADYTQLPNICSVRSCRKYFPVMARGYNAVYVSYGSSKYIQSYVDSLGVNHYDGMYYSKNLFARDQERLDAGYAREHTAYFIGSYFPTQLGKNKVNMNLEASKKDVTAFNFVPEGKTASPVGQGCKDVYINFGSNKSGFIYNESSGTYLKNFYNTKKKTDIPHSDAKSGIQLEFSNIFILHNEVKYDYETFPGYTIADGVHRLIEWKGGKSSKGYYVANGVLQEIYWIKKTESDMIRFYDKQGNELEVNRGKTYICFADTDKCTFKP